MFGGKKYLQDTEICLIFAHAKAIDHNLKTYRGMEQLAARRAHNPKVEGSSPSPATKEVRLSNLFFVYL